MTDSTNSLEENLNKSTNYTIKKFIITGGPCSGKTTALEKLSNYFTSNGYRVFIATEVATLLFTNGIKVDDLDNNQSKFAFQQFVIRLQMNLEDSFVNYAKTIQQNCIILCDRGIMDG